MTNVVEIKFPKKNRFYYFDEFDTKKYFKNNLSTILKIIDLSSKYSECLKNNISFKSVFDKIVIDAYGGE